MKIHDISRELFSTPVYPGDPIPTHERVLEIAKGGICNLTTVFMCAHNATHVDAPSHFIEGAKTIESIPLDKFIGPAKVVSFHGVLSENDVEEIMKDSPERVLFKGEVEITVEATKEFLKNDITLLGVENQSLGSPEVHILFLESEVVLLEGIRLDEVAEGTYFLMAAPILLGGSDGGPCRAVLIEGVK